MGLVGMVRWVHSRDRRHGCGEVTTVPRSSGSGVVTVNDVLDGHVVLDLECFDQGSTNTSTGNRRIGNVDANGYSSW